MSAIVVCGEALMDVFALEDTPTGLSLEARIGGSPFNVAVGLARLAQPVAFFGSISRDLMGERLVRALRDESVDTSSVVRVDALTTLSFVGTDAGGVPSYAFYGEGCADRQLGTDALSRLPPSAAAIHVGSFSTIVEPVASTLRALVETARHRVLISYDPNVRLNVQPDLQPWRTALDWMLTRADIVKISAEDLALLWPGVPARSFSTGRSPPGSAWRSSPRARRAPPRRPPGRESKSLRGPCRWSTRWAPATRSRPPCSPGSAAPLHFGARRSP